MRQQDSESYFPELTGDKQHEADEWLDGYLRLVLRIRREHIERLNPEAQKTDASYPHPKLDESGGTGNVNTS